MFENLKRKLRNINPVILIFLFILLCESIMDNSMSVFDWLYSKLLILPAIIVGLSFHEAAHGFVSYKLGDPTPKLQGRVTINPLKHINPAGFIALLFMGFGWGEPVQINPMYYKNRRTGQIMVSLAGVVTNLIIAVVFSFVLKFALNYMTYEFYMGLGQHIITILMYMVAINVMLMLFNLLPIPPLDGFGLVTQIFNLERYPWYYKLYQNGSLILILCVILRIPSKLINLPYNFILDLLLGN